MPHVFEYSKEDFVYGTLWSDKENSTFDKLLLKTWNNMQLEGGYFKYRLKIDQSKILPGKFHYLTQLNMDRALLRRKPIEIQSMKQEFDHSKFNFTMMDRKEILFELLDKEKKNKGNYLAINVSPLGYGHSLLLPAMESCLPQVVTFDSLMAAVELFLLSKSPSMRMGFNGLCAYASVNHLHFHLYYLEQQMLLETIEVEHLAGPCYMLLSFPSRGFAFQLSQGQDIQELVMSVFNLVNFLQENEKPHNIFITRGSRFNEKFPGVVRDHVRIYVWTRKPEYGMKEVSAFQPALCEMFGHLLTKRSDDYEGLTEDFVSKIMSDLTEEPFNSVVDEVRQMFLKL